VIELPASLRRAIEDHGRDLTILVVRLGALGDILRTLPAVRLLRFALPDARIHWVAWEPWTQLLADHPDLDGVIALPRSALRARARSPLSWPALGISARRIVSEIRGLRTDLVLDFHGDLRSGLLGRLSGAPVRLGFEGHQQKEANRLFTTVRVPSGSRRTRRLDRNLDLVRALGAPVDPVPDAGLHIGASDRNDAADLARAIAGEREMAVLNPGASRRQAYKKPPAALFAAAARALSSRGIVPIVVHGPGEDADAASVVEASAGLARVAPPTSLKVLAALLGTARAFVGGDSGPLHLACGVSCPVVGIYGPTDPQVNAPWGVPSISLWPPGRVYTGIKSKDRATGGFEGLVEEGVARAIDAILSQPRNGS
jgi:ADP-heptose:LPS heptosyltransferase